MPDDLVLTPAGLRPKSQVHLIENGSVIDGSNDRQRQLPAGAGLRYRASRLASELAFYLCPFLCTCFSHKYLSNTHHCWIFW